MRSKPSINHKSRAMVSHRSKDSLGSKVEDRLILLGQETELKFEAKRIQLEQDAKMNSSTPRIINKKFNQRVATEARDYHDDQKEQMEEKYLMPRSQSKQSVGDGNADKVKKRQPPDLTEFHMRQQQFLSEKERHVTDIQKSVYSKKTSQYKFTPKIDENSRKMVQMNFQERLEVYQSKEKEKQRLVTALDRPKMKRKATSPFTKKMKQPGL